MKSKNEPIVKLEKAKSISEVFTLVSDLIHETFNVRNNGLLVAMDNIPVSNQGIVAGLYVPDEKTIVVNKLLLKEIKAKNPDLLNSYLFHVLLHEYLHSIGFVDEKETRKLTFLISNRHFGIDHKTTKIALNINKFIGLFGNGEIPYQNMDTRVRALPEPVDKWTINYIG